MNFMEEYRARSFSNTFKRLPISMDSEIDSVSDVTAESDVHIITSDGLCILAHSHILVSVSTVFETVLNRTAENEESTKVLQIHGVPCEAVVSFIRFLYSNKCTEEEMEKYGIHLLALSHVYAVHHLKQRCTKGLGLWLVIENVLDVLQLARLCDAPDLYLNCMRMVASNFKDVQMTDGWTFVQDHDPWLELEILQFLDEVELRKNKSRKNKEERSLYMELSEAMECLQHICTDGCTSVGPYDMEPHQHKLPCEKFSTCQGVQLLIKHFATCKKRVKGGCCKCKRMWQLFRLHSEVCDQTMPLCRVPLCRQFKMKMGVGRREECGKWRLLARKVTSAKALCSLSCPTRK